MAVQSRASFAALAYPSQDINEHGRGLSRLPRGRCPHTEDAPARAELPHPSVVVTHWTQKRKTESMTLECTLVRGPASLHKGGAIELSIEAELGLPGVVLESAVASAFGCRELTVDGVRVSRLSVGQPPLVNGAVLVDGAGTADVPERLGARSALLLLVHTGPAAGQVAVLGRGRYTIGREDADISIPDPDISRVHAVIEVSRTAITLEDSGSANGIIVNNRRIRRSSISTDTMFRCGGSDISITFREALASGAGLAGAGYAVKEPLKVQRSSESTRKVPLLLAAGLPLVLGVGMAVATGMWWFLAFTAVSAMTALVPLFSGHNRRRALNQAVADAAGQDAERRRRSAPSAAQIILFNGVPMALPPVMAGSAEELELTGSLRSNGPSAGWLRLGTRPVTANIRLEPSDPEFRAPQLGRMPLCLDPSVGTVQLAGPSARVDGLMRFLLMQLAAYPSNTATSVIVYGPASALPLSARFLNGVELSCSAIAVRASLAAGSRTSGVLILLGCGIGEDAPSEEGKAERESLGCEARRRGWRIISCGEAADEAGAIVDLTQEQAALRVGSEATTFVPDLVPHNVFDRFCRESPQAKVTDTDGIPDSCALGQILDCDPTAIAVRWATLTGPLSAPIGRASSGVLILDLNSDGPHVLVAGTTGSGKSELLRSLVASLSACHSPERINFVFIDFKGGSGLSPLAGIPHCVSMLTNLGRDGLDRSLQSLRAEVHLRERLFADASVPDLEAYRRQLRPRGASNPCLPHLVIIVDEFRMLVDEAPSALAELMRIAAIGRSLGIHLVMATQRPQGALTADIRANVTSSIALRVQSDMESLDIINSKVAAAISVATPGRAFLSRGSGGPEEFQAAALAGNPAGRHRTVAVRSAVSVMGRQAEGSAPEAPPRATPEEAASALVDTMLKLWAKDGCVEPRRPIAPPLPRELRCDEVRCGEGRCPWRPARADVAQPPSTPAGSLPSESAQEISVCLGIADQPEEQRLSCLQWTPSHDSHLALIGPPAETSKICMSVTAALIRHDSESHFYVLDGVGSFTGAESLSRVGAVAAPHDLRRGARILQRLAAEMAARLGSPSPQTHVPLVLVIAGWGTWQSSFRSSPLAWAEELVHDMVRDGPVAGITVVITGDRELVTGRFFAGIPTRAFFPAGSTEESRLSWPRMPVADMLPGRAVVTGSVLRGKSAMSQFCVGPSGKEWPYGNANVALREPFRILALPEHVTVAEVTGKLPAHESAAQASASVLHTQSAPVQLWLGVGGDSLEAVSVRLPPAGVLVALGGDSSGKTTLLKTLPALNPALQWLLPPHGTDPKAFWSTAWRESDDAARGRRGIMLIDDADFLSPETHQHLMELNRQGHAAVLTAGFGSSLIQRIPLALNARGSGTGLLLGPRSLSDADFFAARFDVEESPPPGRAILFQAGRSRTIQLAEPDLGATLREGYLRSERRRQ